MQTLQLHSAGLAAVHDKLIEIDRFLRHILRGQTEPPEDVSAWVLHGTRVDRSRKKLSPSDFKAQIPMIRDLIQRRHDLWAVYNDRARPHVPRRDLLDLPPEILGIILSHFDTDGPDRDYTEPVMNCGRDIIQDIQSIRLSCRQLHNEASRLLVPHLSVEMNPNSMKQVERVLAHPLIGPGVRGLRVIFPYYPSEMANDFRVFTRVRILRLSSACETIRTMEGRTTKEHDDIFLPSIQTLLSRWENMSRPSHTSHQERTMIDVAYLAYKELHKQQDDMKRNLGESLAQIMRRMPGITQLEIYDEPRTGRDKIMSWNANSYHSLLSNLSERCMVPLKWEDHDYLGNEPVLMMFDVSAVRRLLVHLGTVGIRLIRLSIKTSAPRDFTGLECEANEQAALQTLAENLQHLHFGTGTQKENKLRSGKELLAVSSFIGLLNSKPNLQVLDVDFEGTMKARIRSHHYTPILSKTPRKPLKKLVLRNANLSATAFGEFLANLNSSLDLVITGCEMADGTWGELMDTMKELADPARPSGERLRLLAFRDLSGAEIDTLGKRAQKIFDEARGRLTSENGKRLSLAHAYVLQMCDVVANPLEKRDIAQILDSN